MATRGAVGGGDSDVWDKDEVFPIYLDGKTSWVSGQGDAVWIP